MATRYSKAKQGGVKLSNDFTVREFACHDGSDTVLIDAALAKYIQRIRNWAGVPIIISSGYRTPAYNKKIGGAPNSYHTRGQAADIYAKDRKKSISEIARFAQAIGVPGVEKNEDSNYVHIDTRTKRYFWVHKGNRDVTVDGFGGHCAYAEPRESLRRGSSGNGVRWLQWWLSLWGYNIKIDGAFGSGTETIVKDFQKRVGLTPDGIAGAKTKAALKGY